MSKSLQAAFLFWLKPARPVALPRLQPRFAPSLAFGARRGQFMVLFAIALVALVGMAGLAVDVGFFWNQRRRIQSAADAGAVAGAQELLQGNSTDVTSAAQTDASLNGFANGVNGASVSVANPPTSGPYAGNADAVQVTVTQPQSSFFLNALSFSSFTLSASAVAAFDPSPTCIYSLGASGSSSLNASSGATMQSACGMLVNSSSPDALTVSSGATIQAPAIGVVGNYSNSGGTISPTPTTGLAPVNDPLAGMAAPEVGDCNYNNFRAQAGAVLSANPGVYCGGISVTSGATLTLNPGTYILDGGGLSVNSGGTLNGSGVTFYNTEGAAAYQPVSVTSGGTMNLSAPTSGTYEGILFFQDRNISSQDASMANVFNSGSALNLEGTLYFPTSPLDFSSGGAATAYTILVASQVSFTSGSVINDNYSSLQNGSPIKTVSLVE